MRKPLYTCLKTKFNRCSSIVCQNVGPMFWLRVVVITAGAHQAAHETPRPSRCRFSYKFANYVGTAARTDSRELTRRRSCSGVSTAALRARGRGRMTRRKKTFAREPSFQSRRKHHSSTSSSSTDGDREEGTERTTSNPTTIRWAAESRFQLYAILAWQFCYERIFAIESELNPAAAEGAAPLASSYSRRAIRREPEGAVAAKLGLRVHEMAGFTARSRNVLHVPFAQAVKSIAFLAAQVSKPVWAAERTARRVVGRTWAVQMLQRMTSCRPPPPFEAASQVKIFVVDQTYARTGGSGTGVTKYRAVEKVTSAGDHKKETRLVYMNGFERPYPDFHISAAATARISSWGPYTQPFDKVVPLLQPRRLVQVKFGLLARTLVLIAGATDAHDRTHRLLARPTTPATPTYLHWLPPLAFCDTKSYLDMIRIIRWLTTYLMGCTMVLIILGDGQTVLRLRDLKRCFPALYKNVLVVNGAFHSHAHFLMAVHFLWWECFLGVLAELLGKDHVAPDIKNLERNSWQHMLQFILPVVAAIFEFLTEHVTEPPPQVLMAPHARTHAPTNPAPLRVLPQLLFDDPELYVSMVENASAVTMIRFLLDAGLPLMWWHRAGRSEDAEMLDDLHAIAFHVVSFLPRAQPSAPHRPALPCAALPLCGALTPTRLVHSSAVRTRHHLHRYH